MRPLYSSKALKKLADNAIKDWHFERCTDGRRGVKPIEGKYDSNNPKHIKPSDIIKISESYIGDYKWN